MHKDSPMSDFVSLGQAAQRVVDRLRTGRPGIMSFPITNEDEWKSWRRDDVTASVAGALFGVHQHTTPYELFYIKRGDIPDPEETPAMERGKLLEPVAAYLLRKERPHWKIWAPKTYFRDPTKQIGCTPDLFAIDPEREGFGNIQVKSVEPSIFRKTWINGDDEIEPPLWIAIQCLIEKELPGAAWTAVAPMRVGHGIDIDLIEIPESPGLMQRLEGEVSNFWRNFRQNIVPEPDAGRDGELLSRLYKPNGLCVDLSRDNRIAELIADRDRLTAEKKTGDVAAEEIKKINAELLKKLAGASSGQLADGRIVTAKHVKRSGYTVGDSEYTLVTVKSPSKRGKK